MKLVGKQPATVFLKVRSEPSSHGPASHGPARIRDNAVAFAADIHPDDFETAVSIRSGIRNTLDHSSATALYQRFAVEDARANGVPALSPFALRLQVLGQTSTPPQTLVPERAGVLHDPSTTASRSSLPKRIGTMAQLDADDVDPQSHRPFMEAGRRFVDAAVAEAGCLLSTDAGFAALHKYLVESSIFSRQDAEGYAQIVAQTPTRGAVTAIAMALRITNGAKLAELQGMLHREHFTNSSYDHGQLNAVLHAPNIVLHEYGHHILAHRPDILAGAIALQVERKALTSEVSNPLTEQLLNDDWIPFDATYQEKFYRGGAALGYNRTKLNNAELLPVALQQLATPAAMKHLHDVDVDLFHFALGVLRPGA